MVSKKIFYLLFSMIACSLFLSAQFTEKRIKRGPSLSALKESCCKLFGDVLQSSAQLLCSLGAIQKYAIASIDGYVMGDKASWCQTASREKLMVCTQKLERLHAKIEDLIHECSDTLNALSVP